MNFNAPDPGLKNVPIEVSIVKASYVILEQKSLSLGPGIVKFKLTSRIN